MKNHSTIRGDHIEYNFWLIFGSDGSIRLTRGQPDTGRSERGMACSATIPRNLFKTPELRAAITIDGDAVPSFTIDVKAAAEALRQVVGCDVDLRITPPKEATDVD